MLCYCYAVPFYHHHLNVLRLANWLACLLALCVHYVNLPLLLLLLLLGNNDMSSSMILSSKVAWWKEEWRLGRDFFMQVPLALAAALQLDRPVFIGSSIGGMLAVDLARYHPQEFRAVIGLEVRRRMHAYGERASSVYTHMTCI